METEKAVPKGFEALSKRLRILDKNKRVIVVQAEELRLALDELAHYRTCFLLAKCERCGRG